jgi:FKBP-type peptidyl-prolyl cis-trans isomerase (trigger factor)
MDDLFVKSVSETVSLFPQASLEQLRESVAKRLAEKLVERQLRELREAAIEAVRHAVLPLIDSAIAEALEVIEHEDDAAWARWQKILADTTVENSGPVQ